jgi:hypothetical protein
MIYQPKGGMCQSCAHARRDCSSLPFSTMPVIGKWNGFVLIVRCTEHKPKEARNG